MEKCNLRRPVHKIQAAISQVLDTMSLAELTSADVPETALDQVVRAAGGSRGWGPAVRGELIKMGSASLRG